MTTSRLLSELQSHIEISVNIFDSGDYVTGTMGTRCRDGDRYDGRLVLALGSTNGIWMNKRDLDEQTDMYGVR